MSVFTANSSGLRSLLHHCATFTPSLFMYKRIHSKMMLNFTTGAVTLQTNHVLSTLQSHQYKPQETF